MRVLVTSQSSALGGIESRLVQDVEILVSLGCKVFVATPRFRGIAEWQQRIQRAGGFIVRWNPYKFIERQQTSGIWQYLPIFSRQALTRNHFDFAHVAMPWTTVGMTRILELTRKKIPIVLGLHCIYPPEQLPKEIIFHIRQALSGVIEAYAVSNAVKRSFLENYGEFCSHFDIKVIPNGVDVKLYKPSILSRQAWRRRLNLGDDTFVVVWCGRLDASKNPGFALDIISQPLLRKINLKLILFGVGKDLRDLASKVRALNLTDRVIFAGHIPSNQGVFSVADVFLTTNPREGFSLTTSEALSSGVPVFVPQNDVFQEIYGACETAHFLPMNSPAEWAVKLEKFFNENLINRAMLSCISRNYANNHLDEKSMRNKITYFYENVIRHIGLNDDVE